MTMTKAPYRIPLPITDAAIAALAALAAFTTRLGPPLVFGPYRYLLLALVLATSILTPAVFYGFRVYRVYWPYAGWSEVLRTIAATLACTLAAAIVLLPIASYPAPLSIPRSVLALFLLFLLLGTTASRAIEASRLRAMPPPRPEGDPTQTANQRPTSGAA